MSKASAGGVVLVIWVISMLLSLRSSPPSLFVQSHLPMRSSEELEPEIPEPTGAV